MQSRMSAQQQEELQRALSGYAPKMGQEMPRPVSAPAFVQQPEDGLTLGVPAPMPTDDTNAEQVGYKVLVFGLLARVKEYPESARARHAVGHVILAFSIDDAGLPKSVSILHSSGEEDLDTEALAMVVRAAPFPVPPAGAQRDFAIDVGFSLEDQSSSE
jgi:TonB family protein